MEKAHLDKSISSNESIEKNDKILSVNIEEKFIPLNTNLIDEIINNYGFGIHTIKLLICNMLADMIVGYYLRSTSNFYIYLNQQFKFSQLFWTNLTISLLFIKSLSCLITGYLLDRKIFMRFTLLKIFLFFCIAANATLLIKFTLWTYIITISIGVFCTGGLDIVIMNNLVESLPSKYRGALMVFSHTSIYSDLVQNVLLNSFSIKNQTNINAVIWINLTIIILITLLNLFCSHNSIRHLLNNENYDEAYKYLEELRIEKLTNEEKEIIKKEFLYSNNINLEKKQKNGSGRLENFKLIFSEKYLKITICFITIGCIVYYCRAGITNMVPMYLKGIIPDSNVKKVSQEQSIINILMFLSYPLGAFMIETSFSGRRISLIFLQGLCALSLLFNIFFYKAYGFCAIFLMIIYALSHIIGIFISETYPTYLRDITQGFFFFISNLFSILGVLVNMSLIYNHKYLPFLMGFILMFISTIASLFITHDTKNKNLDILNNDDKKLISLQNINKEEFDEGNSD